MRTMTTGIRVIIVLATAALTASCAHPIKIAPDTTKLERLSSAPARLPIHVGYFIPPEVSSVEITTPGGGGDNVRYFPYKDIAPGFEQMLSNVFSGVVHLTSLTDPSGLTKSGVEYTVQPVIVTNSGGSGVFTWPPTNFSVDLTCNVRDPAGTLIASPRVVGTGNADTGEKLHDHAIAGKRAMEDALTKMQAAISEVTFASKGVSTPSRSPAPSAGDSAADRLANLKELLDKGLINQDEYEGKRKAIVDGL